MKKIILLGFFMLIFVTMTAIASESCPKTVSIINQEFSPPSGWSVTYKKINIKDGTLYFYIAVYNSDEKDGANHNRMSCIYEDREATTRIEITTNKTEIPKPSDPIWQSLDESSLYCFPNKPVNAAECIWG